MAALFLLASTLLLLGWFFVDLRFYVYAAQVQGNSLIAAEEVYRAGGLPGMSIFYIDRQQVARAIEGGIPGVVQARVQCQLPDRVSVQIREQDVHYVWRGANTAFLVDGEGSILKVDDGAHSELVVIQDLDNLQLHPGDQVSRAALTAAGRLHSLLPEVRVFEYSAAKGISLSDSRGWRVCFGDAQDLQQKVAILQALLQNLAQERRSVKVIDLRFVDSPSYQ
jgi:cell division septal protein FtsQ